MKILRVSNVSDNRTGGMSRVIHNTSDALRRAGHEVDHVFREQLGDVCRPRLSRFVVPLRVARRVTALHQTRGPYDAVEIHEPLAAPYLWRQRRDRRLPPAVVLSFGIEARAHAARLAYARCKGQRPSLKQRLSPYSVVWQADWALRRAAHVVCFNAEDVAYLLRLGRRPDEVTCTHSGVAPFFLEAGAAVSRGPSAPPRLLFLGTWLERKGARDLAAAASGLFERFTALRLTVAGCLCGAARVLTDFPPAARERIDVVPHIDNDGGLADLYRRHTLFVLPSYFEGQPLAMLEAAAMGLPIVTTNVCGMRDFIESGRNGLLVEPGDDVGLGRSVGHLLAHPEEAVRMADAARRKVQTYTWDSSARDMIEAFEAALRR
jgi:glycosyltransferase involved in cell wall biosynthesis